LNAAINNFLGLLTGGIGSAGGIPLPHLRPGALGLAFDRGNVLPAASGALIERPTIFPMASGGFALGGEAGTEAIMPLRRTSTGRLGVEASGGGARSVEMNLSIVVRGSGDKDLLAKMKAGAEAVVGRALTQYDRTAGDRAAQIRRAPRRRG